MSICRCQLGGSTAVCNCTTGGKVEWMGGDGMSDVDKQLDAFLIRIEVLEKQLMAARRCGSCRLWQPEGYTHRCSLTGTRFPRSERCPIDKWEAIE
jgi:hypothetical protein